MMEKEYIVWNMSLFVVALVKITYPLRWESYQEQGQNLIDRFTYLLEMDKEDGMG